MDLKFKKRKLAQELFLNQTFNGDNVLWVIHTEEEEKQVLSLRHCLSQYLAVYFVILDKSDGELH